MACHVSYVVCYTGAHYELIMILSSRYYFQHENDNARSCASVANHHRHRLLDEMEFNAIEKLDI